MGALKNRLRKLEEERVAEAISFEEQSLPADERHERRALERASYSERLALSQYLEDEDEPAYLKLWEEILHRQAPTLAADVRVARCLLHRELDGLERQWREEGRHRSTSYSDQPFWNVAQACVSRMHAVQRGAQPIEDEQVVQRTMAVIVDPATTHPEIMQLAKSWEQKS